MAFNQLHSEFDGRFLWFSPRPAVVCARQGAGDFPVNGLIHVSFCMSPVNDSYCAVPDQECRSIEISAFASARLGRQSHASAGFSRTTIIKTVPPALHERCFAFGAPRGLARCVLCAFTACGKSTFVLGRKAGKIDGICHLRRIVRAGAQRPGCAAREERAKHYQHGNSHGGYPPVSGECIFGTRNEPEQRACPERRCVSSRIKRLRI